MLVPEPADKLRIIHQFLFDLATGRSTVDIEDVFTNDPYDQLFVSLLSLKERLRSLALNLGMAPPYYAFEHRWSLLFILDKHYRITDINQPVLERLGYPPENLRQRDFKDLLDSRSLPHWNQLKEQLPLDSAFLNTVELVFRTQDGYQLPLSCALGELRFKKAFVVLTVEVFLKDAVYLQMAAHPIPDTAQLDRQVVAQVHRYILAHLDEPLPNVKTLALKFGIEAHKLRSGFKEQYDTSIYQFYQDERLKKAYLLIRRTPLQLKEIAYMCGYNTYLNFYKAFKKKYGLAPSALLRSDA